MKIWIIGARGTVATATIVGAVAAREGLLAPEGLLTETPPFTKLDLPDLADIGFGGADLRGGSLGEAARACPAAPAIFPPGVLEEASRHLDEVELQTGLIRGGGPAVEALLGTEMPALPREAAGDGVRRISEALAAFSDGEPVVVVNLASTEPPPAPEVFSWDLPALESALEQDDPRIPASCLYAYAALRAGFPYANFTPSTGAALPAIVELAHELEIPLAGRDGKTGETLVKTALAPMFAIRALTVQGWYGANILGNTDGRVLSDPLNRASKLASKEGVLERCLGYTPAGNVRIDYFPPLGDHKVAWDFIQFRGWGGHSMRMQFTWEGTDAVLAAPLVIDIARLLVLAHRRGEAGPIGSLGLFFKTPEGTTEMNLHRQYDTLLEWVGAEPVSC